MLPDLRDDFARLLENLPTDHSKRRTLLLVNEACSRDGSFLERRPTTLFQTLWNTCFWSAADDEQSNQTTDDTDTTFPLRKLVERWRNEKTVSSHGHVWLQSLAPFGPSLGQQHGMILASGGPTYTGLGLSSDGERIAAASSSGYISLWETVSNTLIMHLDAGFEYIGFSHTGHLKTPKHALEGVVFSPDGTRIASQTAVNDLFLWDGEDYQRVHNPDCRGGSSGWSGSPLVFLSNGLLVATVLDTVNVRIRSALDGSGVCTLTGRCRVRQLLGASGGSILVVLYDDRSVWLWNSDNHTAYSLHHLIASTTADVSAITFKLSSDGTRLLVLDSSSHSLRIFQLDLTDGYRLDSYELMSLEGEVILSWSIRVAPLGQFVAALTEAQHLLIWNLSTAQVARHPIPNGQIASVTFGRCDEALTVAYSFGTIIYMLLDSNVLHTYTFPFAISQAAAIFSNDLRFLILGKDEQGHDTVIRVVSADDGRKSPRSPSGYKVRRVPSSLPIGFGDDGSCFCGILEQGDFVVWRSEDAKVLRNGVVDDCFDFCVASRMNLAAIAAGDSWGDSTISIRVLPKLNTVCEVRLFERLWRLAFSADGDRIAAIVGKCTEDTRVVLYDAQSGKKIRELPAGNDEKGWCLSLAFSPDGSKIATGGGYRGIRVWDAADGQLLKTIETEAGNEEIRFSTDGTHLILHPEDCGMMAYEIATGKCVEAVYGGSLSEMVLRHSCMGGLAATRAEIGDLHIIRYPGRKVIGWLPSGVSYVQFDQNNKYRVGVSSNGFTLFQLHGS